MKKFIYFRLFIVSTIGALTLSLLSLYCLIQISDMVVEDYRYGYMMFMGRKIEKTSMNKPVSKINVNKYSAPPISSQDPLALLKVSEITDPQNILSHKGHGPSLWLVSGSGKIISTNTQGLLPVSWEDLPHPKKLHDIESKENSLFKAKTFIIKLNTVPETFLITHNERSLFQGPFLWIQGLHTFTTAALAVFLALSICFYYVRRKSSEARKVLANLASGDLKARFEIKRFDQFRNLVLDFNRMAGEIERLVKRLNNTETSRSHLLQELGHDLRTPLTSLGVSFEALKFHHEQMDANDREEVFSMIDSDIRYFRELLEKLTIVATIDESHYKVSSKNLDLSQILQAELKTRQLSTGGQINWHFSVPESMPLILGDRHLISRLFKNAFDNASRYAQSKILVKVSAKKETLEVTVTDDGPGLTPEALESFGKRRERRMATEKDPRNFSLGLGSVIMKTIADVHDGKVVMSNAQGGGACLKVIFKLP